ncbi:MAG: hypothetical protein AAF658_03695, partial [Myxococcota bacterium]
MKLGRLTAHATGFALLATALAWWPAIDRLDITKLWVATACLAVFAVLRIKDRDPPDFFVGLGLV